MEIDFLIQDTFALTRPQWKLATSLEDAGHAFAVSVTQHFQTQEPEKMVEAESAEDDLLSEDDGDDDDLQVPEMNEGHSSSEEAEMDVSRKLLWNSCMTS